MLYIQVVTLFRLKLIFDGKQYHLCFKLFWFTSAFDHPFGHRFLPRLATGFINIATLTIHTHMEKYYIDTIIIIMYFDFNIYI